MQKDLPGGFGAFVLVAALVVGPCRVHAQDLPSEQLDSLRAELELLRAQLDSLGAVVASGPVSPEVGDQEETTDALARLRAAAQAAAGGAAADTAAQTQGAQEFVGRARSLQALNPEISLNGDVYASIQSETPGRDNFIPREFELSFVSALDPFTRAKVFLAAEEDGGRIEVFPDGGEEGEGGGVTVEEGYVE